MRLRLPRGPVRHALLAGAAALALVAVACGAFVAWPVPAGVRSPGPVPGLVIQDRHGLVLRSTRAPDGSRGGWMPLADIDPKVIQAFIAAEDRRFLQHRGVDLRSVVRAMRDNIAAGRIVSGASTITMQVARLLRPLPRTWPGKIGQALWALRLETHLPKERILEIYLNRVPLGQAAVGVQAAASLYFGAHASHLGLGEAATLAALARAPSRDNPLVDAERARQRRDAVLARMVAQGFANPADAKRARDEPVLARQSDARFLAPHFTTRIAGRPDHLAGTLRTTLDLRLQSELEAEVRHTIDVLRDRGARHAAVVVLDNPTGDVLAWVGSPDFHADTAGQVDMVVSPRQPGSALKPFLYALAFDRGYTPATVLPDVPRTWMTTTGPYQPRNYDRRFRGPVRIREALASSYNVPAVVLTDRIGVAPLLATLRAAGFTSLDRSAGYYGLGLSLGNGEVTLIELANAYRGLATGGVFTPWRWDLSSPPADFRTGRRFVSTGAAALVLDIMNDPVARIPGFGTETSLDFPFPAAAKTGTSRHFTDNWAVAATARFTVAVWVGNFSGQPMQGVSGITGAGPLLHRSMLVTARHYPPGTLPTPEIAGATAIPVCALSGLRVTPDCAKIIEWFLPGTEPLVADTWQHEGRTTLPSEYAEWLASLERPGLGIGGAPSDDVSDQVFRILSPLDGDRYEVPPGTDARYATIPLTASPAAGKDWPRWFVNEESVDGTRWRLRTGAHVVRAVWPNGQRDSVRIEVARIGN